jgi:hypothetical protein
MYFHSNRTNYIQLKNGVIGLLQFYCSPIIANLLLLSVLIIRATGTGILTLSMGILETEEHLLFQIQFILIMLRETYTVRLVQEIIPVVLIAGEIPRDHYWNCNCRLYPTNYNLCGPIHFNLSTDHNRILPAPIGNSVMLHLYRVKPQKSYLSGEHTQSNW